MCFYDNLSELCKINGITVSGLLAELKMSASNKQKWQNGATVNSSVLMKIADRFNVSVDYLLGRTDNPSISENNISNFDTTINGTQTNIIQSGAETDLDEIKVALSKLTSSKRHRAIADILDLLEEYIEK